MRGSRISFGLATVFAAVLWGQGTAELNRRASELYGAREFDKAIVELRRSLELNPRQAGPAKLLGLCYQLTGREEDAERAFLKVTEIDPQDSEAWFFLGRAYYARNFFDRAIAALETAHRLKPGGGRILEQLALALEAGEEVERALEVYRQAMPLHPPAGMHVNYGMLLYKLNRLDQSEEEFQKARALDREDWRTYFESGKLYLRREKLSLAARELEAALKAPLRDPDQTARISHLLAQVYFRMGREADARRVLAAVEGAKP